MKIIVFYLLTILPISILAQAKPSLIVKNGEVKTLYSRTYNYDSIYIEKEAQVIIKEGGSKWCILWAENNITINGKIIYRESIIGPRKVSDNTPDNKIITHSYKNESLGGFGGSGGNAVIIGGGRIGGLGIQGTNQYGGGGGSGAGIRAAGQCILGGNGNNAIDWRGAQQALDGIGRGGNGGKLSNYCNGGILLIYTKETFNGSMGTIDLSGEDGVDGESLGGGIIGKCTIPASGAGGGSPGGEGGRLIIISKNFIEYPKIILEGGRGGKGGILSGSGHNGATKGEDGQAGQSGFVDFYDLSQWTNLFEIISK